MKEVFIQGRNLATSYHKALLALNDFGEEVSCSDWNTNCKEVSLTMVVEKPMSEPMISKCFIGGPHELMQYVLEITDGILDFEVGKNWTYTYHNRMVDCDGKDQIRFVIDELQRNPDSRRAVICIRNSTDIDSDDPACLQHIQYFIRDNKLDCKVLFRSNDACKASFMNAFAFIILQYTIAKELGIKVGTYTHRANSYHCYERDYVLLSNYVKRIKESEENVCCDFKDEWDELMRDELDSIDSMVKELKSRV